MQSPLQRQLRWLGLVGLVAFASQALISYLAAPLATFESREPAVLVFHARLAAAVAAPGTWLHAALQGESALAHRPTFIAAYLGPTLAATAVAITLLILLGRRSHEVTPTTVQSLRRWSYGFALVTAPALPVLVPDFWLSVAWGRVVAGGGNPYYLVPDGATTGLPLSAPIMHMTYGPLWALVSGALMWLARGSALWGFVLFKLLLGAAWVAVVRLVATLVSTRRPWEQAAAVVAVGWLPVGVVQSVGDGHNDVVMVAFALGWLTLLRSGRRVQATVLLACSVAVKYVTAPLFVLDVLWSRYRDGTPTSPLAWARRYAPQAVAAAVVSCLTFAPYLRSLDFFAPARDVQATWFFVPGSAVLALGTMTGLPLRPVAAVVMLVFPVATAWLVFKLLREPSWRRLEMAVAGVALSLVFVAARHVWPWYVLWLLPFAVLDFTSRLGRWATGVAIAAPLLLLPWTAYPQANAFQRLELPSLVVYAFAVAWMIVAPRTWDHGSVVSAKTD